MPQQRSKYTDDHDPFKFYGYEQQDDSLAPRLAPSRLPLPYLTEIKQNRKITTSVDSLAEEWLNSQKWSGGERALRLSAVSATRNCCNKQKKGQKPVTTTASNTYDYSKHETVHQNMRLATYGTYQIREKQSVTTLIMLPPFHV